MIICTFSNFIVEMIAEHVEYPTMFSQLRAILYSFSSCLYIWELNININLCIHNTNHVISTSCVFFLYVSNREEKLKKKKECLEDQVKTLKNEADQQKKEFHVLAIKNEGLEKQNHILEKQNSDMKRESQSLKLGNKKLEKEIEILQLAR